MKIDQLLGWNKLGLIPGPGEKEADFVKRAEYCLHLEEHLAQNFGEGVPFSEADQVSEDVITGNGDFVDIDPKWIPVFFSNILLAPWHGGCAWVFQLKEDSPTGALLQLREAFKRSSSYLGFYHRDELVAHELSHVGRMEFEEPKFEEILAYRTARSSLRRWLGGIVRSSKESAVFLSSLLFVLFLDCFFIFFGHETVYQVAMWAKLLPLGLFIFGSGRLWWYQRCLSRCISNLNPTLKDAQTTDAVVYRLTDDEIISFSKITPKEILEYVNGQDSLRWRVIRGAYF